ncbi:unnamed protein product [Closterium sp. Naga37s-1]|nr:unnamed protein product [Closterium sp. Naga37s-1]
MALRSMLKTAYGEDTVRIALETTAGSSTAGSTSGVSVLPVTTTVVLGPAQLTFSKQRCASVPKKAVKQRNAQVWWSGPKGSSKANSGGKATGVACSQVKFFGKDGCQGKEIDSMANPGTTTAVKNTKKQLQKGVFVASVLCALPEQQQKENSPQQPQPNADPACAALDCEPVGGTCEVDGNGERYCKWAVHLSTSSNSHPLRSLPPLIHTLPPFFCFSLSALLLPLCLASPSLPCFSLSALLLPLCLASPSLPCFSLSPLLLPLCLASPSLPCFSLSALLLPLCLASPSLPCIPCLPHPHPVALPLRSLKTPRVMALTYRTAPIPTPRSHPLTPAPLEPQSALRLH